MTGESYSLKELTHFPPTTTPRPGFQLPKSNQDKWEELKEYINRQHEYALKQQDGSPAQRLLIGFWKAIKDKMWSIERDHKKKQFPEDAWDDPRVRMDIKEKEY